MNPFQNTWFDATLALNSVFASAQIRKVLIFDFRLS
jgi:hypothetical protein